MSASGSDLSAEDPSSDKALEALRSADLQTRIEGVEALAASGRGVENVVQLLVDEPEGRYLVFERLGRFGLRSSRRWKVRSAERPGRLSS